jgi:hypothetical protein
MKVTILRVPRQAKKFIGKRNQSLTTRITNVLKNIKKDDATKFYNSIRLKEFCYYTSSILNKRLQPGFSKIGKIDLPSIPFSLLHPYFKDQPCEYWNRNVRRTIDGKKFNSKLHYYRFSNYLPDLVHKEWNIRYNGKTHDGRELRSKYVELIFVVREEDTRVKCHFRQTSSFLLNGKWYITC